MTTRPTRIFVCIDDAFISEGIIKFLRRSGYDAAQVHCGDDLLRAAERLRPDAVILGRRAFGVGLCRGLKAAGALVILYAHSSDARVSDVEAASGAHAVISRPTPLVVLQARIETLLSGRRRHYGSSDHSFVDQPVKTFRTGRRVTAR